VTKYNYNYYLVTKLHTKYADVKWVPCHHITARPQVAEGRDGLHIWRLAANILNKQSRTAEKEWSSSLGVGWGLATPHRKKQHVTTIQKPFRGPRYRWEDNIKINLREIGLEVWTGFIWITIRTSDELLVKR
jgi:hypothetical protein